MLESLQLLQRVARGGSKGEGDMGALPPSQRSVPLPLLALPNCR